MPTIVEQGMTTQISRTAPDAGYAAINIVSIPYTGTESISCFVIEPQGSTGKANSAPKYEFREKQLVSTDL